MKITKLDIENFRGIQKGQLKDLKQVNFILGDNNACKTSVLEAIFLAIGIDNPLLTININTFRNLRQTEDDDFRFVFHNLDYNNIPKIVAQFDENNHKRSLQIVPHNKSKSKSSSNISRKALENELGESRFDTRIDSNLIDGIVLQAEVKERHSTKKTVTSHVILEGSSFSAKNDESYKNKLNGVFIFPTAQMPGLDKRMERLIVSKNHNSIVKVLKEIDPAIVDISLGTNGMVYFDIGLERLIPINLAGDGIRRVLAILVTIADTKNGFIVIDEIDNGLHYSSQATLLKALLSAAKEYNVQIFATTHNYETLEYLNKLLNDKLKDFKDLISAFTIKKMSNNEIKAYKYEYEEFHHAIEQEIEIR